LRVSDGKEAAPPLDVAALLTRCMDDPDLAVRVLEQFRKQVCDLGAINQALGEGRWQDLARMAHSVKGAAGVLSAESVRIVAGLLEDAARAADAPRASDLLRRLQEEAQECLAYLPTALAGIAGRQPAAPQHTKAEEGSRHAILIVDDDEIDLEMLRKVLTAAGYEVLTASNGWEALEVLRRSSCRLVISDWVMPKMDGLELCRAIREQDFAGYIYVILLTSSNGPEDTVLGMSTGADDFMAKPYNAAELRVRVRAGQRVLSLETRDVAMFAMAKLAESRDPETGAHLERMQAYSRIITQHLLTAGKFPDQIDLEYLHLIHLTSPLHDIGKVGIPDAVLLKPGRLSDREFEIMKTHTTIGAQTLEAALRKFPTARFLQVARDIAASHHERYDGSGYPSGLAGESIPLCGRIVALADVYDALSSRRVYKQAFTHEIARSIVLAEVGTHFDPSVIEAFTRCEARFVEVRDSFPEGDSAAA